MHIMEGYLPLGSAVAWSALSAPFLWLGFRRIDRLLKEKPSLKLLLGAVAGFTFVLSALKLPSVTGSCSHPTGTGLGTILFGPGAMTVIGAIVLFFQALLLAHGGLTTLGANLFSMGIAGPWLSFWIYRLGKRLALPLSLVVFLTAVLGDLFTYFFSSLQLAIAYPDPQGGISGSLWKFLLVFALTQVPLALTEGFLTVLVLNLLSGQPELEELGFVK